MVVPLFDMQAELAPLRAELDRAIARVLDAGIFIGGPEVDAFEREFSAAIGPSSEPVQSDARSGGTHATGRLRGAQAIGTSSDPVHAIGTSSGTDALLLALMALGVGPGDEVVTTPLTFIATASCAARLGARVVFADVDDALCLDPDRALAACSDRTRAIIAVHLHGHPARLPVAPCVVVEDASHAHGGRPPRDLATYSFFPTKNLGALGDAGAIVTADAAVADRARLLRNHGMRPKYEHLALGGNFRLDALQAAVLRTKLPHLAAWTSARRTHAARYRALFAAAGVPPELHLPPDDADHVYHQFCIRAPRREALRAHLVAAGIGTEVYYPQTLHTAPVFANLGYRAGAFPAAERAAAELLALPIQPALTADAQAIVVDRIAAFYRA